MRLYIGNLSYSTTDESLNAAFAEFGTIASATVVSDRDTGRSRGFGFVEMENEDEAKAAIEGMDGTELDGRPLRVDIARPKAEGGGSRW
jgi:RNA recognition motif-containing protein